jgi:membrane protein DedA with SNARE-associated domain
MNALGGICWASLFGGGAYYFGKEILEVVWPVALSLLIGAIVLIVAGIIYARSHEKELAKRADAALAELG